MDKPISKNYSNGEITIIWEPAICIHSTICWKEATGLPHVFNPRERPWIKPGTDSTERIIEQVSKCPSGALTYFYNKAEQLPLKKAAAIKVEVTPNGPLLVHGDIIVQQNGTETLKNKVTAFCRCGNSANKPFCDGLHRQTGFEG